LDGIFEARKVLRVSELLTYKRVFDEAQKPSREELDRVDAAVLGASGRGTRGTSGSVIL